MKTINVAKAEGAALDWLVWKCAGGINAYPKTASGPAFLKLWRGNSAKYVHPSTDWSQGGPIIERERINFTRQLSTSPCPGMWLAYTCDEVDDTRWGFDGMGSTHLIAAMRCYVASKLGDEIEVPEELA